MRNQQTPPLSAKKIGKKAAAFLAGLAMLATGGIAAATANAAEPEADNLVTVRDQASLEDALKNGGSIAVAKETSIKLTEPITISSATTLTGEGTIMLADSFSKGESKAPITIEQGSSLTINGVTLDGAGKSYEYGSGTGSMLYVDGALNFIDGELTNVVSGKKDGGNSGAIYVAPNGKFTMRGGTIANNRLWSPSSYPKGVVYVGAGAQFEMLGGMFTQNKVAEHYGVCGIVFVHESDEDNSTGGTFNMSGGSIFDNQGTGVKVGGNGTSGDPAHFNLSGGYISSNMPVQTNDDDKDTDGVQNCPATHPSCKDNVITGAANFANGVYVSFGQFTMSGGVITDNGNSVNTNNEWGGGVTVTATSEQTSFIMTGGTVSENYAENGGGLFVTHSNNGPAGTVLLSGGEIVNNEATSAGGGIYAVYGSVVQLENVRIDDNTAHLIGGGIWTCATGNVKTYVNNGGAVFDNVAKDEYEDDPAEAQAAAAGADLAFVKHADDAEFTVAERMVGGGEVTYYQDGTLVQGFQGSDGSIGSVAAFLGKPADDSVRYNADAPGDPVDTDALNVKGQSFALKSVVSENAKTAAKDNAQLIITGNQARRGGGIGSNGTVIIGTAPDDQNPEYSLTVKKVWEDAEDTDIQPVEVALKAGDDVLDEVELDSVNGWTATFNHLPELAQGRTYTVVETNVPAGFTSSVSSTECAEDPDVQHVISCKVTVTNTKEPETPPTPPTPPTPSDTEGDLTIEKKVKGENAPKDREFTFDITLTDANGNPVNGTYGKVTFTDGKATITLKAGEKITMTGIPETYKYTVSEHPSDGFVTTVPGNATGTVGNGHVTVTFTNTWKDLTVNLDPGKKFLEGRELKAGEFTFELWDGDKLVDTATNTVDASDPHYGGFSFSFVQEANTTKTYVMKERKGDLANVTYDTREYQVTVVTGDKGVTSVTYSPELEAGGVVFHNVYEEPKPTPTPEPTPTPTPLPETPKSDKPALSQTGVAVASIAGAALLITAAGVALVIARRRRAQR